MAAEGGDEEAPKAEEAPVPEAAAQPPAALEAAAATPAAAAPAPAEPPSAVEAAAAAPAAAAPAPAETLAEKEVHPSPEEALKKRIEESMSRGEAPIKPEFLIKIDGGKPFKRKLDTEVAASSAPAGGEGEKAATDNAEEPTSKRRRGMNKNKDRAKPNAQAWRDLRAAQLCTRLAYQNVCCDQEAEGPKKCKHQHDLDAFFAQKPASIEQKCPVLEKLGVCPAGLNCRFEGHIVDRKNVDRDAVVLSADSAWVTKIPGVGHPLGETNVIDYSMMVQLRKKVYDFSRSMEVTKAWQRYCSGASDTPLGAIVPPERRTLDLAGKRIMAPLTTVGNLPFRRLCVRLGCEVTVGEMALSQSILEGSSAELSLLRRHESEKCFGIQVAGGDIEVMTKLAQFADEQVDCDFVDINCGCPLDELHRRGAGTRLMARTKCLEGMVRCMSTVLRTKPLTLKMRTADNEDKRHPEFGGRYAHKLVPQLEEWGVSALTLHGRTARQRYTKLADWDYVSECTKRRALSTPFVACGDVMGYPDFEEHLHSHGVDGIMIGRGALIKPWIFTEIAERRHWDISANERFDLIRDFVHHGLEHWGADSRGVENTRKFLLEWLSFTCRYVPVGLLEVVPQRINWRPKPYVGRNDLETKLASASPKDWIEISEMLLGKVPEGFTFVPKHKSASYEPAAAAAGAQAAPDVQG